MISLTFISFGNGSALLDIFKYDVYRGPNIGVYISVNDSYVLVPMGFAETKAEKLGEYLKVKPLYCSVANTRLLGSLIVMNNRGILLPTTSYLEEFDYFQKETDLEVGVLDSKYTALGNVICSNDKGAIVSPWLSRDDVETIRQILGVEVVQPWFKRLDIPFHPGGIALEVEPHVQVANGNKSIRVVISLPQ